jgi:hypothetical protein
MLGVIQHPFPKIEGAVRSTNKKCLKPISKAIILYLKVDHFVSIGFSNVHVQNSLDILIVSEGHYAIFEFIEGYGGQSMVGEPMAQIASIFH